MKQFPSADDCSCDIQDPTWPIKTAFFCMAEGNRIKNLTIKSQKNARMETRTIRIVGPYKTRTA
jgi:hypothetical protein